MLSGRPGLRRRTPADMYHYYGLLRILLVCVMVVLVACVFTLTRFETDDLCLNCGKSKLPRVRHVVSKVNEGGNDEEGIKITSNKKLDDARRMPLVVGDAAKGATFDGEKFVLLNQISFQPNSPRIFTAVMRPGEPVYSNVTVVPYVPWTENIWLLFMVLDHMEFYYSPYNESVQHAIDIFIVPKLPPKGMDATRQMVNSIGRQHWLAGTKAQQLQARRDYVVTSLPKCSSFEELRLSPLQFSMSNVSECQNLFHRVRSDLKGMAFMIKPIGTEHGDGISLINDVEVLISTLGSCDKPKPLIVMEYINQVALVEYRKADLRSYLLVASTKPFLVFYHKGYGRIGKVAYDARSTDRMMHVTNARATSEALAMVDTRRTMEHISQWLYVSHGIDPYLWLDYVRRRSKLATRFVFESSRRHIRSVGGRFQIYAIDWSLSNRGEIGLLEVNSAPLLLQVEGAGLDGLSLWKPMMELVLRIHTNATSLGDKMLMKSNFTYSGWELVYNDLEDEHHRVVTGTSTIDYCEEFRRMFNELDSLRATRKYTFTNLTSPKSAILQPTPLLT